MQKSSELENPNILIMGNKDSKAQGILKVLKDTPFEYRVDFFFEANAICNEKSYDFYLIHQSDVDDDEEAYKHLLYLASQKKYVILFSGGISEPEQYNKYCFFVYDEHLQRNLVSILTQWQKNKNTVDMPKIFQQDFCFNILQWDNDGHTRKIIYKQHEDRTLVIKKMNPQRDFYKYYFLCVHIDDFLQNKTTLSQKIITMLENHYIFFFTGSQPQEVTAHNNIKNLIDCGLPEEKYGHCWQVIFKSEIENNTFDVPQNTKWLQPASPQNKQEDEQKIALFLKTFDVELITGSKTSVYKRILQLSPQINKLVVYFPKITKNQIVLPSLLLLRRYDENLLSQFLQSPKHEIEKEKIFDHVDQSCGYEENHWQKHFCKTWLDWVSIIGHDLRKPCGNNIDIDEKFKIQKEKYPFALMSEPVADLLKNTTREEQVLFFLHPSSHNDFSSKINVLLANMPEQRNIFQKIKWI